MAEFSADPVLNVVVTKQAGAVGLAQSEPFVGSAYASHAANRGKAIRQRRASNIFIDIVNT
jgi:hypothetical protein